MLPDTLRLILAALALYRLAQFVSFDNGPGFVFDKLRGWVRSKKITEHSAWLEKQKNSTNRPAGEKNRGKWASMDELTTCPFCQHPWWAVGIVALLVWPSVGGDVFLLWMGLTGAAAFLQGQTP